MIVKMKFLNITGPKDDIDRVVETYLTQYEVHLENTFHEVGDGKQNSLMAYTDPNPYTGYVETATKLLSMIGVNPQTQVVELPRDEAIRTITTVQTQVLTWQQEMTEIQQQRDKYINSLAHIKPFLGLPYSIHEIIGFRFIRFRFGKMSLDSYRRFTGFMYNELDTFFYPCYQDSENIWGVYFVPAGQRKKVDAIFRSLKFERIFLADEYDGTPEEAVSGLEASIAGCDEQLAALDAKIKGLIEEQCKPLTLACQRLSVLSRVFDIRQLAAYTKEDGQPFFILCGWISEADAKKLSARIAGEEKVFCMIEDGEGATASTPPTKLKNPKLIKPFEMFTNMYGLPGYKEVDPTPLVALTYAFIFGAMFGDLGQGLVLALGGFALYFLKKMNLGAIIGYAGIFSSIFGTLYGSVFGFEDLIPALWIKPTHRMMNLPFFGKLNSIFVYAVLFGIGLILLTIILNIILAIRAGQIKDVLLDNNGILGLIFYSGVVAVLVLFFTGQTLPGGIVLLLFFGIPIILFALKEPLTNLLNKKKEKHSEGIGVMAIQQFFEVFEILLSYFSNTISFVRIGAFAISHAAMMEVVLSFAGAGSGGSLNLPVVILGNIFVCGMEGLVVGIQVLRLEFYEIFSRFYKGTGRPFKAYSLGRKQQD
ncbi:MAG: V-type ATPase 116kDa subunit family protein [Lachnospiraceae bacterium]|nr:V-type ATPase 116kDa subunit family protein [Lachnospiraceae bacterium]MDY5742366.1 V-type ATPase 116kDa subunit family protein [Lachnospiraceae bacterium]